MLSNSTDVSKIASIAENCAMKLWSIYDAEQKKFTYTLPIEGWSQAMIDDYYTRDIKPYIDIINIDADSESRVYMMFNIPCTWHALGKMDKLITTLFDKDLFSDTRQMCYDYGHGRSFLVDLH